MNRFRGIPQHIQATVVLILINCIVFMVTFLKGNQIDVLVEYGAMYPPFINVNHEFWRLFTSLFLHADILHLILNMWSLFVVGSLLEPIFGRDKFLLLYFGSGVFGTSLSYAFGGIFYASVGASAAIYGLFSAVVLLATLFPYHSGIRQNAQSFIFTILVNLGISFAPGIDMLAHIGGLIGGAIMLYYLGVGQHKTTRKYLCLLLYIVILGSLLIYGYNRF